MRLPAYLRDLLSAMGITERQVSQYARGKSPLEWVQNIWDFVRGRQRRRPADVPAEFWKRLERSLAPQPSAPTAPADQPARQPGPSAPPPPFTSRGNRAMREPPKPGEQTSLSEFIDCSRQSSNVFGFQYDYKKKLLYVAFQGHQLNQGALSRGRVKRGGRMGRDQNIGTPGRTVTGARGGRGATYAYHGVPSKIFDLMRQAASKGKFVWDHLRVRGTIYGHQYRYTLVQGQVQPKNGGVYIPRKATRGGYKSRSLVDIGSSTARGGRMSFQTSTLPARSFANKLSSRRRSSN